MKTQVFRKFYNVILLDDDLGGTPMKLYGVLLALANFETHQVVAYVKELAEKIHRTPSTVRRCLNMLIGLGLIERILRKSPHDPKWNDASIFIVHDIDAARYGIFDGTPKNESTPSQKLEYLPPKMSGQFKEGILEDTLEKNNNNVVENLSPRNGSNEKTSAEESKSESEAGTTLPESKAVEGHDSKAETILQTKEKNTDKAETPVNPYRTVPEAFTDAVNYLFQRTGRTSLYDSEFSVLRKFSHETELPVVNELMKKLIDESVERFTRKGKHLRNVTFRYIENGLINQIHSKKVKTDSQGQDGLTRKKMPKKQKKADNVRQELIMPVEEAEKVIADYAQDKKQSESLPTALLELFGKIRAKHDELSEKSERFTLEDYLHLKFPEAEEEELHRDYYGNVHENYDDFPRTYLLEDSFKIDYACATCDDPHNCKLPIKYRQYRKNRPIAKMTVSQENSGKFLEAYCNGCIKCKHGSVGDKREEYEFKDRIKYSGLSARQANQTFDAFDCQNADGEVIVAKAQAILAAKNKSNLILAGKPGTGKSHLASAIALEAMKNGNQAIFKSLPELLDEICFAYQNNTDPHGLMIKYRNVPCLVLDDWGKEKTTDARLDYLFQIIDYRYRNGLQTVLTTNAFDMEGLKNRWNADKIEPLVSRILENGQWVTIYASENHRLKKSSKPETEPEHENVNAEPEPEVQQERQETPQEPQQEAIKAPEELPVVEPETEAVELEDFSEPETSPNSATSVSFEPKAETPIDDYKKSSDDEPRKISEIVSVAHAETTDATENKDPEQKSWQEISESAEYQAMSTHDRLLAKWAYVRESPEYKSLDIYARRDVQMEFAKMIAEADKYSPSTVKAESEHEIITATPDPEVQQEKLETPQEPQQEAIKTPEELPVVASETEADKAEKFSEPEHENETVSAVPEIKPQPQDSKKIAVSFSLREISAAHAETTEAAEKKEPERKSWQEISESADFQAMSERDKLLARWTYFKGTPEYEALTTYDKIAVQKEFCRLLDEAGKRQSADTRQAGCVITVPIYDDGLDDDDDEIKL